MRGNGPLQGRKGRWYADTVIVGAGSSGSVIAARMTENTSHDVLLLEAGPDYPSMDMLPRDLVDGTRNAMRSHDWRYIHRPTPGQTLLRFPRGRVVGGSSAVNTCIALRGHPYDYDEWAALGLPEWSFERCLPAFKRLEDDRDFDNEWHGRGGPIPVRRHPVSECSPWQQGFLEACKELGFGYCSDTNDPTQSGYGPHAMNKIDGVRMSAARGYLTEEVRRRENLRILPHTVVHRVRVRNRKVTGLVVESSGRIHEIDAGRVILSAGAIATPGILLRSGIGPRASVEALGVDLVADIPAVGAHVLDHPGVALFFRPVRGLGNRSFPLIQNVMRFTSKGSGYRDDVQLQPGSFVPTPWGVTLPLVTLSCCVGKSRSRGSIRFLDQDPRRRPVLESRLLEDMADREVAMECLRLGLLCAESVSMRHMATLFWPKREVLENAERFREALPRICDSGYHPCGTVPMGPDGDRRSAVTQYGRMRPIDGLWVADASVMPTIPSSNTNFPTLMMGERFGEWFKAGFDW
jgi:choline dehydrogenase